MHSARLLGLLLAAVVADASAETPRSPSPAGAAAYFIAPQDGDVVPPTFTVKFGLRGMGVAPAGVDQPHTGHHHLLIDLDEEPALDQPLPTTEQVRHFGAGQTETELTLPPGRHTLQLMLGNYLHVPHDPPVRSEVITITVREP
ncbi:MAG TPA: DUF4399 domain-containing protein [Pseudomonadales bacterium]